MAELSDETGYNNHYKGARVVIADNPQDYIEEYEKRFLQRFADGGWVFSGAQLKSAMERLEAHGARTVLDAGSGKGELSVYLACKGFEVTGIEISEEGVKVASDLAERVGVKCDFRAASLSETGLPDNSIDAIIGRNTLHHFIKYDAVPAEFRRITTENALAVFVDPFGENVFKNVFQNKKKMAILGDVLLTKEGIQEFFDQEKVEIEPSNWFTLLDKLLIRKVGWKHKEAIRKVARITQKLDDAIPRNRATLWLAGSSVTQVSFHSDHSHA